MSDRQQDEAAEETNDETPEDVEESPESSNEDRTGGPDRADSGSGFTLPFPIDLGSSGNVGIREGISYGLGLIVYIVGLLLITSILSAIGGAFVAGGVAVDNIIITLLLGLFGFVVSLVSLVLFFAGFAGLQYKIIADAVSRGNEAE